MLNIYYVHDKKSRVKLWCGCMPTKMQLHVREVDDHRIEFVLKGASDAFANGIRRTLMCDVDALAISSVEFHRNTTAFPDEIIAHRIGLLPLAYSAHEQVTYSMHVRDYDGDVFSDAILPVNRGDPSVAPGIFILPMCCDQELHFKAYARRGVPCDHARFGVCVAPAYAVRHEGVFFDECLCEGTERETRCVKCGRLSASSALCGGEFVHWFAFETTGVHPVILLNRALEVLHSNVMGLYLALS